MPSKEFIKTGTILYIDSLLVSVSNWLFWIIVTQMSLTSEIGQATLIISLAVMVGIISQMGFEYPLVKKMLNHPRIFGTGFVICIGITVVTIPVALLIMGNNYNGISEDNFLIILGLIVFSSIFFTSKFSLLGISDIKSIFIIDLIGTGVKFGSGFLFLMMGLGTTAIILAFLFQIAFTSISFLIIALKHFGFHIEEISLVKEFVIEGIANTPSKISRTIIFSSSVVLLGIFNIDQALIGIFYMGLMISVIAAGFASNIAFMSIPATVKSKVELSLGSIRIGMSITSPLITIIMVLPKEILSILGKDYTLAEEPFFILSLGIIPYIILMNTISKLNNLNKNKNIIILGIVQISIFITSFVILVPIYNIVGASLSIFLAFLITGIISMIFFERKLIKYTINSIIAISVGVIVGFILKISFTELHPIILGIISITITISIILQLKNMTLKEITGIVHSLTKK